MYNLLLSTGISLAVAGLVLLSGFPVVSAIVPAVLVWPLAAFLIGRRVNREVTTALAPLAQHMQAGRVSKAVALMRDVQTSWGRWQPFLHGQLEQQLGMLDYMQMKFDEAAPKLAAAPPVWAGRDWRGEVARACIAWRAGDLDAANTAFEDAAAAGRKEPLVYVVWAWTLHRKGDRERALKALSQGLEQIPGQQLLRQLKNTIANKQPIQAAKLPDGALQFFPEELAQQAVMRGRRGPGPLDGALPAGVKQRVQQGPPQPKARGKLARRR